MYCTLAKERPAATGKDLAVVALWSCHADYYTGQISCFKPLFCVQKMSSMAIICPFLPFLWCISNFCLGKPKSIFLANFLAKLAYLGMIFVFFQLKHTAGSVCQLEINKASVMHGPPPMRQLLRKAPLPRVLLMPSMGGPLPA